ncbi:MAG: hypothetical protein VYA46_10165 [Verrucomicrobiota bacterium]|nr:hypothetical protein [Verrucomicrobiota bacterium]
MVKATASQRSRAEPALLARSGAVVEIAQDSFDSSGTLVDDRQAALPVKEETGRDRERTVQGDEGVVVVLQD